MNGQRQGHELIFLDATVIMGIQKGEATVLIERILLDIHSGRIDMRSQDVEAVLHGLFAHAEEADRLVHPDAVYAVSLFQLLFVRYGLLQLHKAFLFCAVYDLIHALALGLCFADEFDIFRCKIIAGLLHFQIIRDPGICSFHTILPSAGAARRRKRKANFRFALLLFTKLDAQLLQALQDLFH